MKIIELPVYGIKITSSIADSNPTGEITCTDYLYQVCKSCGGRDCCFQCDESTAEYVAADPKFPKGRIVCKPGDDENEVAGRLKANGAVDAILSIILAHSLAGIAVESPAYLEGIETAFDAIST